jgi:hypothetical protein
MKYAILNNDGFVVEVLDLTQEQGRAFGFLPCDDFVANGSFFYGNVFYPPKPSAFHFFDNQSKQWIFDEQSALAEAKEIKIQEIADRYIAGIQGSFAVRINDASDAVLLPAGKLNDKIIAYSKRGVLATQESKKPAFIFVRFSTESLAKSQNLSIAFATKTVPKTHVFDCAITIDGVLNLNFVKKICVDASYLKLDRIDFVTLDKVIAEIDRLKTEDSFYKDDLIKSCRLAKTLDELDAVEIKYKSLEKDDISNIGFNPTIILDTAQKVVFNSTGYETFYE